MSVAQQNGPSRANGPNGTQTAIVGMAGRFPGADDIDALWSLLSSGTEAVRRFSPDELRSARVAEDLLSDPDYLPFGADLEGIEDFDAAFFGITPAEARIIDPQQRIFLETVWAALENAGAPPTEYGGSVGVFGSASLSSYLLHHVLRSPEFRDQAFTYPVLLGNDKDFLATRASYALNLHGPSVSVQSACSSSLVAVDQACAALRSGRCDIAVAGGVSVFTPQTVGYRYQPGGTYARDGHCRPFDAAASGMVRGSGCGVVVLKRLDDALADRDHIHAVVAGTAVNNDGADKAAYSAPSPVGQDQVIRSCLDASGVPASSIGYVEAHGTGTCLGDPIEVAALQLAYECTGDPPRECALGSVKANIGHLDAAAGIAGLIKTALVLRHQTIPPQANFTEPNPELRLQDSPFVVHRDISRPAETLRAAAVTSLGIGGTNAHAVLTQAPVPAPRPPVPEGDGHVLLLSAPDEERVRDVAADLLDHLDRHRETRLDDLAYTLAHGRLPLAHRAAVAASTMEEAVARLRDVREGRFEEPDGDVVDSGRIGDVRHARKIPLPGVRLRRVRHWIEPGERDQRADGPAGAEEHVATEDPVGAAAEVFRRRLGVGTVGPDDDYFDLGGDSLHAIDVVDALSRELNASLTLEQFTGLRTPRRVAEWCGAVHDDSDTTVLIKDGVSDEQHGPVFLIHPSGGTVSFALALAEHSTGTRPLYGIGYPAGLTDSLTTVSRMAQHYVRLIRRARPHGPYVVGGYSLGGTVALEVARLLSDMGERVEQVLLWDTLPPQAPARTRSDQEFLELFPDLLRTMFGLPEPEAGTAAGAAGATPPRTVEEAIESVRPPSWTEATVRELRTMFAVWRVCDQALAAHQERPYGGRVHLFRARQPLPAGPLADLAETDAGPAADWRRHLTGDLEVTDVPGHHFSMFDAVHLPGLGAAYDRALARSTSDRGAGPPPGPVRRPGALLFPGQGTQYAGVGRELFARYPELVQEADEVLGYSIADVCAGDPRRPLRDTVYTQPAVYVVGALALRRHLEKTGDRPAVVLGHSVGEYNALEAAGVFSFAEGLQLVAERGAAMAPIEGRMIAVSGLAEEEIREIINGSDSSPGSGAGSAAGRDSRSEFRRVDVAASNAPLQQTLAGPDVDLELLSPVLLTHGARSVRRLDVSGPFHSRLMAPAARDFRAVLGRLDQRWAPPAIPVIANTTARPHDVETLREELIAQIDHTVLWQRSIERAMADHDPEFHEIGGRGVLMPMVAQVRTLASGR